MTAVYFLCAGLIAVALPLGPAWAQNMAATLAPSGTLRIAVYPGSPTSLVADAKSGEKRGVTVEIGAAFARKLGVPFEYVVLQRPAEIQEQLKAGAVDFTITNATPERAANAMFGPILISLELGFVVPADSPLQTAAELDKAGVLIGVTRGSSSEKAIAKQLKVAQLKSAANLEEAKQMLLGGAVAAYATNKSILYEMTDKYPNLRILDGRWGEEHLAIAVPRGREAALDYLRAFTEEIRTGPLLGEVSQRAGLRGQVPR